MNRYRFKLNNERIIGPFTLEQINELKSKGKLKGDEIVQEFPAGEWKPIAFFPQVKEIFENDFTTVNEETFIANLKDLDLQAAPHNIEELKIDKEENSPSSTEEEPVVEENDFVEYPLDLNTEVNNSTDENDEDDTKIRNVKLVDASELEQTQINPEYQRYLQEQKKKREEEERRKEIERQIREEEEEETDYENEKTQMLSASDIAQDYTESIELNLAEVIDKKPVKKKKRKKLKRVKEKTKNTEKKEKKGLRPVVIIGLVFVLLTIMFLGDDEDKQKGNLSAIKFVDPKISFPIRYDKEDEKMATEFYKNGLEEYKKHTYVSYVKASQLFLKSVENKFENNPAMAKLILLYSHNLINSEDRINDANSIFKLVQIFKLKAFSDPNYAAAIAYFYYAVNKNQAALKMIDKYKTLNPTRATYELFSVRLMALVKSGDYDEAKKVAEKLYSVKNKDLFVLRALYKYYKEVDVPDRLVSIVDEASKVYPDSVFFLLELGLNAIDTGNLNHLKEIIYKLNELELEGSRYYYSRYLILKGMYNALMKHVKLATADFMESLKLYESVDLIEKLASLSQATDAKTDDLIAKSKANKLIRLADVEEQKNNLQSAFKYALEASSIAPNSLKVKISLAELQLKRGYISDAITQLEALYKNNPSSINLLFTLIDAYTQAYKFGRVLSLLGAAENIVSPDNPRFCAAKAKYSLYRGDLNSAVGWLQRSVNRDPLNDKNIYDLAKLYLRFHEYEKGKQVLKKAFDLDPANVDYRVLYAKILYELEDSDAAISYLINVLEEFKGNAKLYSAIGIYYYKSGQIKNYKIYKEKLLALPHKDATLFKFLIESARLDDDLKKVVENSEKYLEINPGDLDVRIQLANLYMKEQKYKLAKKHLDIIAERLQTYPKLQFLMAKLNFMADKIKEAKALAEKEIKENPSVVDGYLLLGDIYIKEKDLTKARDQYLKAARVEPDNIDATLGLAFIAFHSDQYDMALDQYQKAIELDPTRAEVYRLLGDAYRKLGQSQFAIKNYKHFLEISPNSKYKATIQKYIKTMQ